VSSRPNLLWLFQFERRMPLLIDNTKVHLEVQLRKTLSKQAIEDAGPETGISKHGSKTFAPISFNEVDFDLPRHH
jgi:hypothetical protein